MDLLILTPEASTNWLFNESILFNLLVDNKMLVMDKADFIRYKKLARISDIDFLKYYLLSFLKANNKIKLIDYKQLYLKDDISLNLHALEAPLKSISNNIYEYDYEIINGYQKYLDYISNKERILKNVGNQGDVITYNNEKADAEGHLSLLEQGRFDKENKEAYIRRLFTKMMSAHSISTQLNAKILDSLEYLTAVNILEGYGISIRQRFDNEIHIPNYRYMKLMESMFNNDRIKEPGTIPIPLLFLEGIRNKPAQLINLLKSEIDNIEPEQLKSEVIDYLMEERETKDEKEEISFILSIVGLVMTPVSFVVMFLGGLDILSRNKFNPNYSLVSQLIANISRYEKNLDRGKIRMKFDWINWVYDLFNNIDSEMAWVNTQRSMAGWTKTEIYLPWYEDVSFS